ncbi:fumarylacetoacetate hydrolase family protein (plasmid) [Natrinema zhouii]|uniref:fumarylacetoacetate hydrolase family protein n=1 Tax=Natrinema zhouii TaxID=1710539 RepID=UPI001CFFEF71|nr:fumarylacetoacetate hydrolase family protein [Natrinema zhouii]UHQ98551.1 fumarylacetoacetate hydrolase family protein [Natrinema zhouii]
MRMVRFSDSTGYTRRGEWTDDGIVANERTYNPDEVDVLPPTDPTKIVCQAGGYMDHREESGFEEQPERPELFLKTPNCVVGHGNTIELPPGRDVVEFEAEFGIVIGEQCRSVPEADAMDVVAGFTCVNDISNRDDQERERNWVRGKAFDASLPMGPVVASPDEVPADATLTLRLNGETKQETTREHMIFSVPELVADVTELITLEPGDVLATGTPFGPDRLSDGDTVEVEFDGVGTLENHVIAQ